MEFIMVHKNALSAAAAILVSIEPVSTGSAVTDVTVQGNWPSEATHALAWVVNDGNTRSEHSEYFLSKEDMETRVDELWDSLHSSKKTYAVWEYEWDLGPNCTNHYFII